MVGCLQPGEAGRAYLAEKPKSLFMISLTRFSGYCLYRLMIVSRWLAHSLAEGPCSVREFPSAPKLVLPNMALLVPLAFALAYSWEPGVVGVGVVGGLEDRPSHLGATARFSATIFGL